MNESDLENELRTLRPVAPSVEIEDRIAVALGSRQTAGQVREFASPGSPPPGAALISEWLRRLGWAFAGATAALAVMFFIQRESHQAQPNSPSVAAVEPEAAGFIPAGSESEFVDADTTGILYTEGAEPFRQMRFLSVERYVWTDPDTGARIEVEVPREDVVQMPVAMQ